MLPGKPFRYFCPTLPDGVADLAIDVQLAGALGHSLGIHTLPTVIAVLMFGSQAELLVLTCGVPEST